MLLCFSYLHWSTKLHKNEITHKMQFVVYGSATILSFDTSEKGKTNLVTHTHTRVTDVMM